VFRPSSVQCRASGGDCDPAEFCTGSGPGCPPDQPAPDNTPCTGDGNDCTNDICLAGVCSHPAKPDSSPCASDGVDCTNDICLGGVCSHPAKPDNSPCASDGNNCTDDVCVAGACTHPLTVPVPPECAPPIPTLSEWTMILLAAFVVLSGVVAVRRRRM